MAKTGVVFYKSSLNKCYRQIEKVKAKYEKKVEELLVKLGELGSQTAWNEYHSGQDELRLQGSHTIAVTFNAVEPNVIEICANGRGVCFLEFGAGLSADPNANPLAEKVPFEVRPGSWSETHSKQYSTYGKWWWNGIEFQEITRHSGMYEAYKAIIQRVYDIAKEVFG